MEKILNVHQKTIYKWDKWGVIPKPKRELISNYCYWTEENIPALKRIARLKYTDKELAEANNKREEAQGKADELSLFNKPSENGNVDCYGTNDIAALFNAIEEETKASIEYHLILFRRRGLSDEEIEIELKKRNLIKE
ncbi:MAG: hypothetical protein DRP85_00615 [Candidatus Makaraimicrobium thalassicum]|nr:MAG: hypothetical protein DRP85_00615 [Candidatus Omnitrophota bacterium]